MSPHQLTRKQERHPVPRYFSPLPLVLSLFHRCLKDFKKSCMRALGPDEAEAACRQNKLLLDSWMKTSLIKHQPSPGNKSLAPALQECLQSHLRLLSAFKAPSAPHSPGLTPSLCPGEEGGYTYMCRFRIWPGVAWMGSSHSQAPPSCQDSGEISAQGKKGIGHVGRE